MWGAFSRHGAAALAVTLGIAGVVASAGPAQAATVGTVGPSYAGTTAPTAEKPESKLWYANGTWWGVLFASAKGDFDIYRLDRAANRWVDTGVVADGRTNLRVDVLWTGAKLYVAAAGTSATSTAQSAKVHRFSWTGTTWKRDTGFPVTAVSGGMEAVSFDRDGTGVLWLTYTRNSTVYVTHSTTSDLTWVAPYKLPVAGVKVSADDIASVTAFKGAVGVMWGNQKENAYYFAVHKNGAGDRTWTRETAYKRTKGADDHMNVKVIRNDPQGRLYAFVKTSLTTAGAPLNVLLVRRPDGTWDTDNVVGTADQNHTRELVVIDSENDVVYVFTSAPCCSGGKIYMKKASIPALFRGNPFPSGQGTVVMSSSTHAHLNNPTSTKQSINSTSDLVVIAGDDHTKTYMFTLLKIGAAKTASTPPDTTLMSGPTDTGGAVGFVSTKAGSTFECSVDGAKYTACTSPFDQSGLAPGDHTFSVRAVDAAGAADPSPASVSWTMVPPTVEPTPAQPVGDQVDVPRHSFWQSRWAPLAGGGAVLGIGLLIGLVGLVGSVSRRRRERRAAQDAAAARVRQASGSPVVGRREAAAQSMIVLPPHAPVAPGTAHADRPWVTDPGS